MCDILKQRKSIKQITLDKREVIVGFIFISIFSAMIIVASKSQNNKRESINKYGEYTIGRVYKIAKNRSVKHVHYYFYYNSKRYDRVDNFNGTGEEYLNNFYRVKFSSQEPNYSIIYLNAQITDTAKIREVGYIINQNDLKINSDDLY